MHYKSIKKEAWDKTLEHLLLSYTIFAGVENEFGLDYELIDLPDIPKISYNKPKPVTPLKNFFLPVKENVTSERAPEKSRIIIGVPNCDIEGLCLLDEIYLDNEFTDKFYRSRRENTILIASDCFGIQDHCHCLSYDIKPFADKNADMAIVCLDEKIILRLITSKGEEFAGKIPGLQELTDHSLISLIEEENESTRSSLLASGNKIPGFEATGELILEANSEIWERYSSKCVSCGACTTICPTCSCFLLIEKPDFGKVKQMDTCQYPGFERVAGGEDALFELHNRFRNRYMCKYVWKSKKFNSKACTGCGRCIEGCIGKINKNEIFMELANNR